MYIFHLIRENKELIYINQVDEYINSILDQKFDYKLDEMDDSINSKLNARFNKMAAAIHNNFDRMHTDNLETKNYLADISHQIKTPLTSLQINNEILAQLDMIGPDEKSFLDINDKQIERLKWLTDSILKLSKLKNNTIKLTRQEVDFSQIIEEFTHVLEPILIEKNIKLVGYGLSTKFTVDPDWTKEGILNIVKNASEHCFENTDIEIRAEDNVSYKSISITNKGPKIQIEDMNKIFERFYKISNSTKSDSVGIGLNLSKKIIEMQGGTISVHNQEDGVKFTILSSLKNDELTVFRRRNIGFIFQFFNLVPVLDVYENIKMPLYLDKFDLEEREIYDLCQSLGIKDKMHAYPNELSGGSQQRVSIARALVAKPKIILADEPTGNLDTKNSEEVIKLLKLYSKKYGITVLLVTHDLNIAAQSDRIIKMEDGKIQE